MKNIQTTFCLATIIGGMLSVASCNSEDEIKADSRQVPLEIEVGGVQTTRGIIEGNTLPEECQYGIFAMAGNNLECLEGGTNVQVNYIKGTSTPAQNVLLSANTDVPVYAYYPYNAEYTHTDYVINMPIAVQRQTDFLYGYSADSDHRLTYVNENQPKANIYFKHVMARVTMRIKKAADNSNPDPYTLYDCDLKNVYQTATLNMYEGGVIQNPSGSASITVKPNYNKNTIDYEREAIVDFLVIPDNTEGKDIPLEINMKDGTKFTANLPATNWQSGQQYTYMVTIKDKDMKIEKAIITQWNNNEQGNLDVNNENNTSSDKVVAIGGTVGTPVDLGIGLKWASHNVGATLPEERGGLYGWADPTGKNTSNDDDTYPSATPPQNICGSEYDIARVQWGGNWRLPSKTEVRTLITSCIWTFTSRNGMNGYEVKGPNGNSIFLPAAGYRTAKGFAENIGTQGYYWTGDLYDEKSWFAYYGSSMSFDASEIYGEAIYFRSEGLSVRPVIDE